MSEEVNAYGISKIGEGEQHYISTNSNQYNRFYSTEDQRNKIGDLINEAISIYIDQSYQLTTTQLLFKYSEEEMIAQMEDLVNQSLRLFHINQIFPGFSVDVEKTLHDITTINWGIEKYLLLGDDEIERDQTLTAFINQEFMTLKNACHIEVSSFIEDDEYRVGY
jgi:hypothetical protein